VRGLDKKNPGSKMLGFKGKKQDIVCGNSISGPQLFFALEAYGLPRRHFG
jgi:hypothetical protein